MEKQSKIIFAEGMGNTERRLSDQQDQHIQQEGVLREEREEQNVSAIDAPQQTKQIPDFQHNLRIYPKDAIDFCEKYKWGDYLIIDLGPGRRVVGKGLDTKLRECYIYMSLGNDRYTFNLGEDGENRGVFHKIPENMKLVIIENGKKVFAAFTECGDETLIYRLNEDMCMDIYFQTVPYKGRYNLYYGYISTEPRYGFYVCNINCDPQAGETFFRSFARTVNTGRKETLARKAKMI